MRKAVFLLIALAIAAGASAQNAGRVPQSLKNDPPPGSSRHILESLPDRVAASRQVLRTELRTAALSMVEAPEYIIVGVTRRWPFDRSVRVAFRGGNDALYSKIEAAASTWITIGRANVKLRFKNDAGQFYKWTSTDVAYAGEIRVAFSSDKANGGYWSHVGSDSTDRHIEGGSPNEASMNLDSFDIALPSDWRSIVIHEFGHALGFEHEHQNPQGGCDFRFDDDSGYVRTIDPDGYFSKDKAGRRPGLYTSLSGKANFWNQTKVDRNLRVLTNSSAFAVGPFDKLSVMKYYFEPDMFIAGAFSPCYSAHDESGTLSAQDIAGVRSVYPASNVEIDALNLRSVLILSALRDSPGASLRLQGIASQRLRALQ